MAVLVRVVWVLLMCVLALVALALVMGVGTLTTGLVEKGVLLLLIGGCVYASFMVTKVSEWVTHRLSRP